MKLYTGKAGSNPKKVAIFLKEKGIDVPSQLLDMFKFEQRQPAFLQKNSLGTLPVLELDDGTIITESLAICRYFEAVHPEPALFGTDAVSKAKVEMWCRRVELEVHNVCGQVVQHTAEFFKDKVTQIPEYAAAQRELAARKFAWLNDEMSDGREFIAGDFFSMADIIGFTGTGLAQMLKIDLPDTLTHFHAWHGRISARPAFQS